MKIAITLSLVSIPALVHGLSSCILNCQSTAGDDNCATSNYNATSCYCDNGDFATDTRSCISDTCQSDLGDWYSYRGSQCGAGDNSSTATATSTAPFSTATAVLSSCILQCQESAAESASGCTADTYNSTSCYCDSTTFATDTANCILEDCAADNDLFHSWRGSVCQSDTTTTETASSTTATATSTTSSSSGPSSGSKDGLSGGDIAGICVGSIVGGLAIISAAGWYMMRRKRIAAARKRYNMADSYRMSKAPSRASTQVAGS